MLTLVMYGVVAILVGGALFLLAAFVLPAGEQIAPAVRDEPPWDLPASRRLDAADVADTRLPVALRGYRFAETDLLLDRLTDEIRERDEEITRLRMGGKAAVAGTSPDATETATPDAAPDGEPEAAAETGPAQGHDG